ncbi:MAG: hypothetical protein ACEPO2_11855 [Pelagibaca sp.]
MRGRIELQTVANKVPEDRLSVVQPIDDATLPWPGLITGVWVLGFWYWVTNQYIVQRAARTGERELFVGKSVVQLVIGHMVAHGRFAVRASDNGLIGNAETPRYVLFGGVPLAALRLGLLLG